MPRVSAVHGAKRTMFENPIASLSALSCPRCGEPMSSVQSRSRPGTANRFEDCLRRCEACRIGASNSATPDTVTYICEDPLKNIPAEVADGALETLNQALNFQSRESKRRRFGFSTSEDAITWVVFTHLRREGGLGKLIRHLGLWQEGTRTRSPALLLWGVPVDAQPRTMKIRERLITFCRSLKEDTQSLSEPDVIIDLGESGLVFIEVKYRSGNDFKPVDYAGWERYFRRSGLAWNQTDVRATGCYELARNWRLLNGLADGRPAILVSLGLSRLFTGADGARLDRFIEALGEQPNSRFRRLTWRTLLACADNAPPWFVRFCSERQLQA
jgi:hypothetical protein